MSTDEISIYHESHVYHDFYLFIMSTWCVLNVSTVYKFEFKNTYYVGNGSSMACVIDLVIILLILFWAVML